MNIPQAPLTAPSNIANINQILNGTVACAVINWLFYILIMLSIIFTLVAAFRYLTSAGEPEKVKRAASTLVYVVVAIVVALIAKGFPYIISNFFGVQIGLTGC